MAEAKPVFGLDMLQSVKLPKPPSKAEQRRIARNATHPSGIDTSSPPRRLPEDQRPHLKFPGPHTREIDGRKFTTVGRGAFIYDGPSSDPKRMLLGRIADIAVGPEYGGRTPHPNKEMMPSGKLFFDQPVRLTAGDEIILREGMVYGDLRGEVWNGMIEPSTKQRMREAREKRMGK